MVNYIPVTNSYINQRNLESKKIETQQGQFIGIPIFSDELLFTDAKERYIVDRFSNINYVMDYGETLEIPFPKGSSDSLSLTGHEIEEIDDYIGASYSPIHYITAGNPTGTDGNERYDKSNPDEEFFKIEMYNSLFNISNGYTPTNEVIIKGSTTKNGVLNALNNNKNLGSATIVRIYSKDKVPINKYSYNNGDTPIGPKNESGYNSDKNIFFELKNGKFTKASSDIKVSPPKLLKTNTSRKIPQGTSRAYMDSTIEDFFVNNEEFDISSDKMSYIKLENNKTNPDTSKIGTQVAHISVLEYDEATKKEWKKTYEIPYEVVKDAGPRLETKGREVTVGTTPDELDRTIEESFEEEILSKVNYQSMSFIEYPDTSKTGQQTGKIKVVGEENEVGTPFDRIYDVTFNVTEEKLSINLQSKEVPVGTNANALNAEDYVKEVALAGKTLDSSDYTVSFVREPNTMKVGKSETEIKVVLKDDKKSVTNKVDTNVIWADTFGSSKDGTDKTPIDVSVSMLHDGQTPYLVANDGNGLNQGNTVTLNKIYVYRGTETKENEIFYSPDYYPGGLASQTRDLWNNGGPLYNGKGDYPGFKNTEFHYGDVVAYEAGDDTNLGIKTWTSRDEKLVNETVGYKKVYYEMTSKGYNLLKFNQLKIKNNVLVFDTNMTEEEMNQEAIKTIEFPRDMTDKDKEKFTFKIRNVDKSKLGKQKVKIDIYEALATGGEFKTTKDVEIEVKAELKVELQQADVPVGTKSSEINANDYVKTVKLGDKTLDPSEYTATLEKAPDTSLVSIRDHMPEPLLQEATIKVVTKADNQTKTETAMTNITWGHTITSRGINDKYTATSLSLLTDKGKPYIEANRGMNTSTSPMNMDPTISLYRGNINNSLITDGSSAGVDIKASETVNKWNKELKNVDFQYGDVFGYTVSEKDGKNSNGSRTFATRNEKLIKETEGYEYAYYELTKDGYRLMHFNQLTPKKEMLQVSMGTDLSKEIINAFDVPKDVNLADFRFEVVNADTTTTGKKTTQVNIHEKLSNKQEFMSSVEINYFVKPQVTEKFLDTTGKELKSQKTTEINLDQTYQGKPDNFVTYNSEVYSYQGWLPSDKNPGKDKPTPGNPPVAKDTATYQYIYEKADNLINMTIPTELLFGTEENSNKIASKNYKITNNSKDVKTDVVLDTFETVKSDVTLLGSKDKDPSKQQVAARFNLMADQQPAISSLTEKTTNETIKSLEPQKSTDISLSGLYFGPLEDSLVVDYQMHFKFKVVSE